MRKKQGGQMIERITHLMVESGATWVLSSRDGGPVLLQSSQLQDEKIFIFSSCLGTWRASRRRSARAVRRESSLEVLFNGFVGSQADGDRQRLDGRGRVAGAREQVPLGGPVGLVGLQSLVCF